MSTEIATATVESTEIEKLQSKVSESQSTYDTAQTESTTKVQSIMSVQPIDFIALAAASEPVARAKRTLDNAVEALRQFTVNDKWESSIIIRQPLLDTLRQVFIDAKPTTFLSSVSGTIKIDESGQLQVTLNPTWNRPDISDDTLDAVVKSIDVEQFKANGFTDMSVVLRALDTESPVISLDPSGNKTSVAKSTKSAPSSNGSGRGSWKYTYKGQELGSKAFLQALEANNDPIIAEHDVGLETALRGSGYGMSNLAKQIAEKMKVPATQS